MTILTLVQAILLAINALLVYYYLKATREIAQRNREQVAETHLLVKTTQEQLSVSQEQIRISLQESEAQIRPALTLDKGPDALSGASVARHLAFVQNVGNGPALDLRLDVLGATQPVNWSAHISDARFVAWDGVCIEKGVNRNRAPLTLPEHVFGNRLALTYKSLSGKGYGTIIFVDNAGLFHNVELVQN